MVNQLAVWVRISVLPIEYYDQSVLTFIGNRIRKTIKVDRTTLSRERGKYASLCIQVDLTKPLLAMFAIKDRHFKIEYKGLHLLCLKYGKYGHSAEGCGTQMEVGMYREGGTNFGPNGQNSSEPHNKEQEA